MTPWPHILAVDTSALTQAVALVGPEGTLAARATRAGSGHASGLLASIDAVLREGGLRPADLDLCVIGAGPGSFTGLRVGLASLKTLAWVHRKPLVSISSLEALALDLDGDADALRVPLFDARKGQLYAGVYRSAPGQPLLQTVLPDGAFDPDALLDTLAAVAQGRPLLLAGDGLKKYSAALADGLRSRGVTASLRPENEAVRAEALAFIARRRVTADDLPDLALLEPNYQRASEAEVNYGPPDTTTSIRR